MKRIIPIVVIVAAIASAGGYWWLSRQVPKPSDLTLYGNIDLRQVSLAFEDNARITAVLAQEGDRVHPGQVLGHLDTGRLLPQVAEAAAQTEAQQAAVLRAHNGSRPQEIAEAKAQVVAANADAVYARGQFQRLRTIADASGGRAVSRQDLDNAQAASNAADARLDVARKALDLAIIGPRAEDIAQAEALLRADQAREAYLRRQLADATLVAPVEGVVRSRLLEPGDMASPERPVYSLAIVDPKWVRAYVPEADLGRLHPGMTAWVSSDSFPKRRFEGWIGFISPMAEFTPKSVETTELRPSLVYEVRVFVKDPHDDLRLGMPATVTLASGRQSSGGQSPAP